MNTLQLGLNARFQVSKTGARVTCSFKAFVKANFLNYTYESTFLILF